MAFSTTEVFGFSDSLLEFMKSSSDELTEKGINVKSWITEIETTKQKATKLNDEQEKMKAALKDFTAKTQKSIDSLYDLSSTKLDSIIGALDKKSQKAKQAAKMRSKINSTKKTSAKKDAKA